MAEPGLEDRSPVSQVRVSLSPVYLCVFGITKPENLYDSYWLSGYRH